MSTVLLLKNPTIDPTYLLIVCMCVCEREYAYIAFKSHYIGPTSNLKGVYQLFFLHVDPSF